MQKIYNDINLGVLKWAPSGKRILDIGCGTGILGAELKRKNNFVYGVDISSDEIAIAKNHLDAAKVLDIMSNSWDIPKDFDVIILADVLEHLTNPEFVLSKVKEHLKPGGQIIVSLPNIACYNIRLQLLFGQFNYKDYGTLDNTHLRFFTRKTAKKLIRAGGYRISHVDVTPFFIRPFYRLYRSIFTGRDTSGKTENDVLQSGSFGLYRKWIFPIEAFLTKLRPTLLAYQFIIVADKL